MPARAAGPGGGGGERGGEEARRLRAASPPAATGAPLCPGRPGRSQLAARRHAGLEAGAAARAFPPSFDIARVAPFRALRAAGTRRKFVRRTRIFGPTWLLALPGGGVAGPGPRCQAACLTRAGRRGGRGEGGEGRAGSLAAGRGPRQRRGPSSAPAPTGRWKVAGPRRENEWMDGRTDETPPTQAQAVPGTLVVCTVTAFLTWTALPSVGGAVGVSFSSRLMTLASFSEPLPLARLAVSAQVDNRQSSRLWDCPRFLDSGESHLHPTLG